MRRPSPGPVWSSGRGAVPVGAAGALGAGGALGKTRAALGTAAPPVRFVCLQYHQLQDEYFTCAVVLALLLAALFGLVYLLIIPQ